MADGLTYEGRWEEGMPQGEGEETMANGNYFSGTFLKGKKHGSNCFYKWVNHPTYSSYKGSFKYGKICGEGALILANGTIING